MRHAALAFAETVASMPEERLGDVEAIFATSMLAVADLRATLPRRLADRPFVLYMHENQMAYPARREAEPIDRERDAHLGFTNLASVEAADRVVWNSRWNLDSFVEGMTAILRHAPERVGRGWIERLEAKSVVIPPPIEMDEIRAGGSGVLHNNPGVGYPGPGEDGGGVVRVAWPHRWEHDKGPDELLALADEAWAREQRGGPAIRWWLLGQRFERVPKSLETMLERHGPRIEHAGAFPRPAYLAALHRCDWVLSTARHEFFGMAVAEALVAGCLPWLPRRLSYPELVPAEAFDWNPWTRPEARGRTSVAPGARECRAGPGGNATKERLQAGVDAILAAAEAPVAVASLESVIEAAVGESSLERPGST